MMYLYLSDNQLTGSIPAELFSLPNIRELVLSNNLLSGPIPAAMSDAGTLRRFFAQNMHLSGPLPADFGDLQNLQMLWIENNDLYGPIPESFADLNLTDLNMSGNGFWSTNPDVIDYLDAFDSHWDFSMGSQGLLPTEGDYVGWGVLDDAAAFLPVFQFNKQFNNVGTAAPVYLVLVRVVTSEGSDDILQVELDRTDTSICPAS